jgi:hypothetical protein
MQFLSRDPNAHRYWILKLFLFISVADPDHFDADPDPTSEKNRIQISDPAAYTLRRYVVFAFCPKLKFLLKVKLGYTSCYLGRKKLNRIY